MKRLGFTILMLFVIFCIAACRKTQESPIVIHKDMDIMIDAAQANSKGIDEATQSEDKTENALANRLGVPNSYSIDEVFHQGKLRITGSPTIELPSAEKVPVVRVTHENFSQETVNMLFDALCGDTVMYQRMALPTKEYIEKEIALMQQQIALYDGDESAQRAIQNQIKELEGFQKILPDKLVYEVAGPKIMPQPVYNMHTGKKLGEEIGVNIAENPSTYGANAGKYFEIKNNIESDEVVINKTEGGWAVFSPGSRGALFYYRENPENTLTRYHIEVLDVTKQQMPKELSSRFSYMPEHAIQHALEFWHGVGLNDVQVSRIALIGEFEKNVYDEIYDNTRHQYSDENISLRYIDDVLDIYYEIELVRSIEGIPISSDGAAGARLETNEFSRVWQYEKLSVILENGKITEAIWSSPHHKMETAADDSALLPFADIDAVFRKMFSVIYAYTLQYNSYGEHELFEVLFELENIRFSLRRVMEPNQVDFGLFVPVWDFYGTQTAIYDDGHKEVINLHEPLLITINGVDGSIIDIDRGY